MGGFWTINSVGMEYCERIRGNVLTGKFFPFPKFPKEQKLYQIIEETIQDIVTTQWKLKNINCSKN